MAAEMARRMGAVVVAVGPEIRAAGFRKFRHTFNRSPETGLVHVVNFQMGPYEPPGTISVPGLREDMYGMFAINFGIFLEEIGRAFNVLPKNEVVHEYHCEIRGRAGRLSMKNKEWWFRLDREPERVAAETSEALGNEVIPFLDAMSNRRAILDAWFRGELSGLMSPRSPLAMAVVLKQVGEIDEARRLTSDYLEKGPHGPAHVEWATERARALDLV